MNSEQMLQQTGVVDAISRELGVDPQTAQAGATALMPAILSGFQNPASPTEPQSTMRDASSSSAFPRFGGLEGLLGTIGGLGGSGLLDNVTSNEPTEVDKGNQILGQIFGSKDRSRAVAAQAAGQSGVEPSLLKKMLPILAMVAAGYVMKKASQGGGIGGGFGSILGGQSSPEGSSGTNRSEQAGSNDILGELIGAAGKILGR
jgi:hypothetical protein